MPTLKGQQDGAGEFGEVADGRALEMGSTLACRHRGPVHSFMSFEEFQGRVTTGGSRS